MRNLEILRDLRYTAAYVLIRWQSLHAREDNGMMRTVCVQTVDNLATTTLSYAISARIGGNADGIGILLGYFK